MKQRRFFGESAAAVSQSAPGLEVILRYTLMPQAERFPKLRDYLRAFEEPPLESQDFEEAAAMSNHCRARGIAGSPIDFLICAMAHRRTWQIFTLDRDFTLYAKALPVVLYAGS